MPIQLTVLDTSAIGVDMSYQKTLLDTIDVAQEVEELGYHRYWFAEHHGPGVAHSSPILMVGFVAGVTDRIRVGTAGVLLPFHSPLRVANDFFLLESFFPGRIDLGLGSGAVELEIARALVGRPLEAPPPTPGADPLQKPHAFPDPEEYQTKVAELLSYLRETGAVRAQPPGVGCPDPWVLGAGGKHSSALAARHGAGFGLALFFRGKPPSPEQIERYRAAFQPSEQFPEPRCIVAVAGICAETRARAGEILNAWDNPFFVPGVVGDPGQCRDALLALCRDYGTNEVVFLALCKEAEERLACYRLLARAVDLA